MAKKGFLTSMIHLQREIEKTRLAKIRTNVEALKEVEKANKVYLDYQLNPYKLQEAESKAEIAGIKAEIAGIQYSRAVLAEVKRQAQEENMEQVAMLNEYLQVTLYELNNILSYTLDIDDFIDLDILKTKPEIPEFNIEAFTSSLVAPHIYAYLPPEPKGMQKLLPGAKQKYEQEYAEAHEHYNRDLAYYNYAETRRKAVIDIAWAKYQQQIKEIQEMAIEENAEVDQLKIDLTLGKASAIVDYCVLVLESSVYPDDFPQAADVYYNADPKLAIIEYLLPTIDIVPEVAAFKYLKSRAEIVETPRPSGQIRDLYLRVIAQIALRTIHELFEADRLKHLDKIVFNGVIPAILLATGEEFKACLISVLADRSEFMKINLARVDPIICIIGLGGAITENPEEVEQVEPIIDLDRFNDS